VFFTPFHIAFSLEKKTPSKWIRLIFPVGSPKKKEKGVDGHDREVERVLGFHDLLPKSTMHGLIELLSSCSSWTMQSNN
jgi:hypothetical protein